MALASDAASSCSEGHVGKIGDILRQRRSFGLISTSFEVFPPRSEAATANLLLRARQLVDAVCPTFLSLTWRAAFDDESVWLSLGTQLQKTCEVPVLLHLTCHLPRDDLVRILAAARDSGIRNILALRGDPPVGSERWRAPPGGFEHASELVRLIRELHGDWFSVGVAGFPETHWQALNCRDLPPSEQARELDLIRLRDKVAAGGDFIVTQHVYEPSLLLAFIEGLHRVGLPMDVPVVGGYMPIASHDAFAKLTSWCGSAVPHQVREELASIADDDAAVKAYGVALGIAQVRDMLEGGLASVHFFTLNLSASTILILEGLGLVPSPAAVTAGGSQQLRGSPSGAAGAGSGRSASRSAAAAHCISLEAAVPPQPEEGSRPIFWQNKAASLLARTQSLNISKGPAGLKGAGATGLAGASEFPNGRFSYASSPAFGELTDYYLAARRPALDRRAMWGTPTSEGDVRRVFCDFLLGRVRALPWCDEPPSLETGHILSNLLALNEAGFLTINSQPRVNGLPSTDARYGWGGPGGTVYQKAYVEFFCDLGSWGRLLAALPRFPSLTYHAIDGSGREWTNVPGGNATAVTWGVFTGEICTPTVVDPSSFRLWAHEAFDLWVSQWGALYEGEDDDDDGRGRGGAGSGSGDAAGARGPGDGAGAGGGSRGPGSAAKGLRGRSPSKGAAAMAAAAAGASVAVAGSSASPSSPVSGGSHKGGFAGADVGAAGAGASSAAPSPAAPAAPASRPGAGASSALALRSPEASARALLAAIADTYVLVNIVDNGFVEGDIFAVFRDVISAGMGPEQLRGRVRALESENAALREQLLALRDMQALADADQATASARAAAAEAEAAQLRLALRQAETARLLGTGFASHFGAHHHSPSPSHGHGYGGISQHAGFAGFGAYPVGSHSSGSGGGSSSPPGGGPSGGSTAMQAALAVVSKRLSAAGASAGAGLGSAAPLTTHFSAAGGAPAAAQALMARNGSSGSLVGLGSALSPVLAGVSGGSLGGGSGGAAGFGLHTGGAALAAAPPGLGLGMAVSLGPVPAYGLGRPGAASAPGLPTSPQRTSSTASTSSGAGSAQVARSSLVLAGAGGGAFASGAGAGGGPLPPTLHRVQFPSPVAPAAPAAGSSGSMGVDAHAADPLALQRMAVYNCVQQQQQLRHAASSGSSVGASASSVAPTPSGSGSSFSVGGV